MTAAKLKTGCKLCGGTGRLVLAKSWVRADGFRRTRCGICKGTGSSSYRPDPQWVREQRKLRCIAA